MMRVLALDVGDKRIGIAVSDPLALSLHSDLRGDQGRAAASAGHNRAGA